MSEIQNIGRCVEKFAPSSLAESWDNTGVLIDVDASASDLKGNESSSRRILLTIDMTEEVLDECIAKSISYVICYHSIIFHPIKKLTCKLLIKCIQNGISVYSPHTQLDPLMNKFVLDFLGTDPGTLEEIVEKLKKLSGIDTFRIVRSVSNKGKSKSYLNNGDIVVGVGSAFKRVDFKDCLVITGEMSHSDNLKCKYNGVDVILMEQSNSERIFLNELYKLMRADEELNEYEIVISENDRDPIEFI